MGTSLPSDLQELEGTFDAVERDARALVMDVTKVLGAWRPEPGAWSIAECLDHLATANGVYLRAMGPAADAALAAGRLRRGPVRPGIVGRWFVRALEPPVSRRLRTRSPHAIRPAAAVPLDEAADRFFASQSEVRSFLRRYAAVDLAGTRFPNPLVRGVRFSLATGLHVLAAHERRHLWQAWRVRQAAERAAAV